jgi:hypothetical protein
MVRQLVMLGPWPTTVTEESLCVVAAADNDIADNKAFIDGT